MAWIGFDVGGTFIDIVGWDGDRVVSHKVPSAPSNRLAPAVLEGLRGALERLGSGVDVEILMHGTTVATNTLIERRGAPVGLITTEGFRDVLEIGRQTRVDHFNVFVEKVRPLCDRRLRVEVSERMSAEGHVIRALDRDDLGRAVEALLEQGVEAVAICFLNSYRNPEHELQAIRWIAGTYPELTVSPSSDVTAEYGEYERTSTTVMNEYLRPPIVEYLDNLEKGTSDLGIGAPLRVIQSNGGMIPASTASRFPVRLLTSGPAAGLTGAAQVASDAGYENIITFDMGGTSTDVGVVVDGEASYRAESEVDGHPLRVVMNDIRSIGAGGGSLVRVDGSGSLHVGPESAGADPGPMCYEHGGEIPTITDANVVLGFINPERFCGGAKELNPQRAREGIERHVAKPVGVSPEAAALGIARVAVTNLAGAVRQVTTERGLDMRDFTLVAYGGAGPLYASLVARELAIPWVLIPRLPGLLAAFGLLVSDFRADSWRTYPRLLDQVSPSELETLFEDLQQEAVQMLEVRDGDVVSFERRIEMCYQGQRHEIGLTVPPGPISESTIGEIADLLQKLFQQKYRFTPRNPRPQIVTLRVFAVQQREDREGLLGGHPASTAAPSEPRTRLTYFPGYEQGVEASVVDRDGLKAGDEVVGPAIVEEDYSTTVVAPGQSLSVLSTGDLLIRPA